MSDPVNVTNAAETNLIGKSQMSKVREVDFVAQFSHESLAKLIEVLGVTRKIPMQEGTTMYMYTTSGSLQSGAVPEGEIIPLSRYQRNKVAVGEITLNKWRKATSAEAIMKSGYDEAVRATDAALLKDVEKKHIMDECFSDASEQIFSNKEKYSLADRQAVGFLMTAFSLIEDRKSVV